MAWELRHALRLLVMGKTKRGLDTMREKEISHFFHFENPTVKYLSSSHTCTRRRALDHFNLGVIRSQWFRSANSWPRRSRAEYSLGRCALESSRRVI
jgi:hypothetical protein